jgi:hypothetical protein
MSFQGFKRTAYFLGKSIDRLESKVPVGLLKAFCTELSTILGISAGPNDIILAVYQKVAE